MAQNFVAGKAYRQQQASRRSCTGSSFTSLTSTPHYLLQHPLSSQELAYQHNQGQLSANTAVRTHSHTLRIAPDLIGSHNASVLPAASSSIECYGCYTITGPATLIKTSELSGCCMEAYLGHGAQIELYRPHGNVILSNTLKEEVHGHDAVMHCICVGQHMEIKGPYDLEVLSPEDTHHVHVHDGKLVLSVGSLHEGTVIKLEPGAQLCHPIVIGH
ncbi:hypothetical protein CEUSTIGMA_g7335.t1 [Chlamydomonas eustigma]|uniref:Uncharacterized protein n=1 Tax=Chlamydomonas eustigma TaxID=1157962 RepID=A0A250X9W6_9CHLO|nr:hypothetical protein CEUSTIGMA_g7335.t1 [Chlamydomonas eustigma]|eukprot:GAX79895.1 hypothetical protein CEUSTIGMA_g7335.t1 [Chlamydomonas eustigma]